jgi:hypothetical protein
MSMPGRKNRGFGRFHDHNPYFFILSISATPTTATKIAFFKPNPHPKELSFGGLLSEHGVNQARYFIDDNQKKLSKHCVF